METEVMSSQELLAITNRHVAPPQFWVQYFKKTHMSSAETINLENVGEAARKMAPFVLPSQEGKPIFEERHSSKIFTPAYVKMKDAVIPKPVYNGDSASLLTSLSRMTTKQRRELKRLGIIKAQKDAHTMLLEYMRAKAIIDGKITIKYDGAQATIVDFGRHPDHDITLTAGARWGDAGVSIKKSIQGFINTMFKNRGGNADRIVFGTKVWDVVQDSPELEKLMDKNLAGSDVELARGLVKPGEVRYVGHISGTPCFVYNAYYHEKQEDGTFIEREIMDPRDVVLTSAELDGYDCYGTIQDERADYQSLPFFQIELPPERNTGNTEILGQSAPLTIPTNPNGSLRARVVA